MKGQLTTADLHAPGIRRIKRGRGFEYRAPGSRPLDDQTRQRVASLVIPPAWQEVWICPEDSGHIQAVGTDEAGRRQYLYHPKYLKQGSRKKFRRARKLGNRISGLRRTVHRQLRQSEDERVRSLALAILLIDQSHLRVGSQVYAKNHGTFGVTTLRCEHLISLRGEVILHFPGKAGQQWHLRVRDREVADELAHLGQRGPQEPLIGYATEDGWVSLSSREVNEHIKLLTGSRFTAKDFRTWHGTMTAARFLRSAKSPDVEEAWAGASRKVASALNNTAAVAASAYIDPGLAKLYQQDVLRDCRRLTDSWLAKALGRYD